MATHLAKSMKKPARRGRMNGRALQIDDIVVNGSVHIPRSVTNHDSFRQWACSNEFPQRGQYFCLGSTFWVDLSMETLIHNQIKSIFVIVVGAIVLNEKLGRYYGDRMMLTNVSAGLSCEPDGMFVSTGAFKERRVTLEQGNDSLEVIGAPDMVLEVVSKTSVDKDMVKLMSLYAGAGIPEYWIVDSTAESPELGILRLSNGKYVATRKQDGWVKSRVLGRSFRLDFTRDDTDLLQFGLESK